MKKRKYIEDKARAERKIGFKTHGLANFPQSARAMLGVHSVLDAKREAKAKAKQLLKKNGLPKTAGENAAMAKVMLKAMPMSVLGASPLGNALLSPAIQKLYRNHADKATGTPKSKQSGIGDTLRSIGTLGLSNPGVGVHTLKAMYKNQLRKDAENAKYKEWRKTVK